MPSPAQKTRKIKRSMRAHGVKALITAASFTATIGGWAAFTTTEPPPIADLPPLPVSAPLVVPQHLDLHIPSPPTLVPALPAPQALIMPTAPAIPRFSFAIVQPPAVQAAAPPRVARPAPQQVAAGPAQPVAAQPAAAQPAPAAPVQVALPPPPPPPAPTSPPLRQVAAPPPVARTHSSR